jgi:creatinine amidohydrolase
LENSGVRKCLILNSHGGNTFKGHLRELFGQTSVQLFLCNWFTLAKERYREVFSKPEDHAGEMETSLLLHARPDLVRMAQADPTPVRELRFEALRKGWVELTRPWHLLTPHSGSGDPTAGTAEKGKRWLEIIVPPITDFVVELAASPLDEEFPFRSA